MGVSFLDEKGRQRGQRQLDDSLGRQVAGMTLLGREEVGEVG